MKNSFSQKGFSPKRYTRKGAWTLFLMCALPLHAWTFMLALRDYSWLADRTNAWDAIGVFSYGLLFALIETLFVFLVMLLLGFLVSRNWLEQQRIALLGSLVLIASLWAMLVQLFYILEVAIPNQAIDFLIRRSHPLRFMYLVTLSFVGLTVAVPTSFILRSSRFLRISNDFIKRLSLLSSIYMSFDIVALMIILIRNF